ncbi:hypothetical protein FRC0482_01829 [Corynebacterium diphtheriae]|nr:hypothetical protein FRC0482_01829 [Corynebacterium diphtheriae]
MNAKTAGRENHPKLSSCGFRVLGFEFSPVCHWVFCDLRKYAACGGEVCLKLPVVTRQHLILGVTIAGMSISRHLDQYLSERGLVQRAEVVPEDGCQEFLPADRWFGDMPEGEMVENDTPQKYFFDESTGDVIDQARSMIEELFRS